MVGGCRLHGRGCTARWGWDRAHTDSDRPYTVDELAGRREGPHFYAYPSPEEYERGWRLWRALRRDATLSAAEAGVKRRVEAAHAGLGADFWDLDDQERVERLLARHDVRTSADAI